MSYPHLHRQLENMKKSLLEQRYLDEQFLQLEELQDDTSPNFVEEVVSLFFKDSTRSIDRIEQAFNKNPHDFRRLDTLIHQLKDSSSSIGACKVKNECSLFKEYCSQGNPDRCTRSFQKVKNEHSILKQKMEAYFQLARQLGPLDAAARPN